MWHRAIGPEKLAELLLIELSVVMVSGLVVPLIATANNRPTVFARCRQCACLCNTRLLGSTQFTIQNDNLIRSAILPGPMPHSSDMLHCGAHLPPPYICPFP